MATPTHPDILPQKIACSVCLAEVPVSSASTPEVSDYIGHYCGIECHEEFTALYQAQIAAQPVKNQK